jgi:serine protease Do
MLQVTKLTACKTLIFAVLLTVGGTASVHGQDASRPAPLAALPDFTGLSEKLAPTVVNISVTTATVQSPQGAPPRRAPGPGQDPFGDDPFGEFWRRFFGEPGMPEGPSGPRQGLASGFVIDAKGLILTNNHVVEQADKITVRFADDREFSAKVLGRDPRTDIAVIQITDSKDNFSVAPLGNSDKLRVGEWVVAMGSPFGLDNTLTVGVVSAKGRRIGAGPYDNFIQTDASINPGNSGGPLVNLRGEVIGVNTAIFSRSGGNMGIGFAIPIDLVKEILPELIKSGKVTRGWLGVSIQRVTPEIAQSLGLKEQRGALVAGVMDDSPAAQADIRVGDVIVEYNGKPVQSSDQLPILVARTPVGQSVQAVVLRDKQRVPINIKIAELKEEEVVASAPAKPGRLGLTVQNLTPQVAESLGVETSAGVVVTAVQPQSAAAEAGLRRGDVVLEINRKRVANVDQFETLTGQLKAGENVLILLRRGNSNLFLALKAPGSGPG